MNLLTRDFEKINFNTFEKSDGKSEDNIDPGAYCYSDITLNNFETIHYMREKLRIFIFTKKCRRLEGKMNYFISIPCNYHFNRYLFYLFVSMSRNYRLTITLIENLLVINRPVIPLTSFYRKKQCYPDEIESKELVLLTQLFSPAAAFKCELFKSQD